MEIGFVGLGKMGLNMVTRLRHHQHRVVVYDRVPEAVAAATQQGCIGTHSLAELVGQLTAPRTVWVMVPSGAPTEETIHAVAELLQPGDTIIDGGNTNFHDDTRRAGLLTPKGIHYMDVGTSGGVWGLANGYCLMVGGYEADVVRLAPVFTSLAPPDGWAHVGAVGAGHYVKMVHNGIEYSMMQGYAEGFELMAKSNYQLDLARIADLWMHGSVVRSWLLELAAGALKEDPRLDGIKGYVQDSGEGRWMLQDAIDKDVPVPTLATALFTRFRSRQDASFAERLLAGLRNAFGGHGVRRADLPAGAGPASSLPDHPPSAKSA
ncbi:MAG: decarboxylating 6-phosphogluconate dehydrogenase [Nitrospiraceae bacterium]